MREGFPLWTTFRVMGNFGELGERDGAEPCHQGEPRNPNPTISTGNKCPQKRLQEAQLEQDRNANAMADRKLGAEESVSQLLTASMVRR